MVNLTTKTTKERIEEYSKYCLYGGIKYDDENQQALESIYNIYDQNRFGAIVFGGAGSGKTLIFSMLQRITPTTDKRFFIKKNVLEIVTDYNEAGHSVFNKWSDKNILFDDLGTEDVGKHYGDKVEVMEKFLQIRYELYQQKRLLTHITTNLTTGEILNRYGARCVSRLKEMNEIVLLGVSKDYQDKRTLRNFAGLPEVYHPIVKSQEDIEWEKNYEQMKIDAQNRPYSKPDGIGTRMKSAFEQWENNLKTSI